MKIIFVLGKGGVGKSTYSEKLALGKNAVIIHCDEIIRPWLAEAEPAYAFDVYRPISKSSGAADAKVQELKKRFVAQIREMSLGYDLCICEGCIEDPDIICRLSADCESEILYLVPASKYIFKKNMIARVESEYIGSELRLTRVWSRLQGDLLADFILNGTSSYMFQKFMDEIVDEKFEYVMSTLELLGDLEYKIVKIEY